MSDEMGSGLLNATVAANVTEVLIVANETDGAAEDSIEVELERFRFYTQGVIVTPVSVFGIIGESALEEYSVIMFSRIST